MDPVIWVLLDERAGNNNQSLGVAESLNLPFETKQIAYNKFAKLPDCLKFGLLGLKKKSIKQLSKPYPDIIIAAGRKLGGVARYIKKKNENRTKLIQIMLPSGNLNDFDLIAVPKHDNVNESGNIVNIVGAAHRVNEDMLSEHKAKWILRFADFGSPKIALLIGGNTKKGKFTIDHAKDLVKKTNALAKKLGASVLATNSRRTDSDVSDFIRKNIKAECYFHDAKSDKENPFFGFLSLADYIVATGDSISMCSEACSTGKPVYIYSVPSIVPKKHQKFHKTLYDSNAALPLGAEKSFSDYKKLDETERLAQIIKDKLL